MRRINYLGVQAADDHSKATWVYAAVYAGVYAGL
jgi:hypothetical protein